MRVVGIALVRNEDLFVRQALLNVSSFCDRILVADTCPPIARLRSSVSCRGSSIT